MKDLMLCLVCTVLIVMFLVTSRVYMDKEQGGGYLHICQSVTHTHQSVISCLTATFSSALFDPCGSCVKSEACMVHRCWIRETQTGLG